MDRQRRWLVGDRNERTHHHEVRADAFASELLSPVARYFGITTSLAAHGLSNLGHLSGGERERFTSAAGESLSGRAPQAMRLLALADEWLISMAALLHCNEQGRAQLFATAVAQTGEGPAVMSEEVDEVSKDNWVGESPIPGTLENRCRAIKRRL